ncbi:hypothetical protein ACQ4PT_017942 [Festuca glaucescens]
MAKKIQVTELLSEEEEIRSMAADDKVDPYVEECLRAVQSEMQRMRAGADDFPTVAMLDWVDAREGYAVALRDTADEDLADLEHGLAIFAGRAGEEALVSELRRQAAWCAAMRADADALAADAWRLRDGWLRHAAVAEDGAAEDALVATAAEAFLEFLAMEMDGGGVPEADAARADAIHTAATARHGLGARFAAEFVGRLVDRFRRGAETYAGQQENVVADGLRRRAAEVEMLCADPETLVPRLQASGWWMFWMLMNRHAATPAATAQKPTPTPTPDASASY